MPRAQAGDPWRETRLRLPAMFPCLPRLIIYIYGCLYIYISMDTIIDIVNIITIIITTILLLL